MTKFRVIGAAAVLSTVLAGPAMAQHAISNPGHYSQSNYCAGHEPGNPYSMTEDYMAWSGWRARGGWDDHNDWKCEHVSQLRHHGAGF
jgi:hypothetical protein